MKRKYILLSIFLSFGCITQAQLNQSMEKSPENRKEMPEKVLIQLMNAIDPASFTDSFIKEKNEFMAKTTKINTVQDFAKSVSILSGYIKPNMFKSNFNVSEFKNKNLKVKTASQAGDMIKDLEKNLKPLAFSSVWKLQRNGWLDDVSKLK